MRQLAIVFLLAVGLVLGLAGCRHDTDQVDSGYPGQSLLHPYLQLAGPSNEPVVIWTSAEEAVGRVVLTTPGELARVFADDQPGRHHALRLVGLRPATEYTYQVSAGTDTSLTRVFRTAPRRQIDGTSAPFTFVVYGDNRSNPDLHRRVIDSIRRGPLPVLVVSTGDLVYAGADSARWFREFLVPADELFSEAPCVLSLGNHDLDIETGERPGLARWWLENFVFPGRPDDPGYGRWFSLDVGGVHFVHLDSTEPGNEDQVAWLAADLAGSAARAADFRVAVFHHPPYTAGHHPSELAVREHWEELFVRQGIDLVFNGHNHYYQRTWPVTADGAVKTAERTEAGVDLVRTGTAPLYIVTGGGGAPLYDPEPADFVAVSAKRRHHVQVDYTPGELRLRAIAEDGQLLDEFVMRRAGEVQ
jgi:hypothetical protein